MASEYHESDFDVSEVAAGGSLLLQEQVSNHCSGHPVRIPWLDVVFGMNKSTFLAGRPRSTATYLKGD